MKVVHGEFWPFSLVCCRARVILALLTLGGVLDLLQITHLVR